MKAHQKAKEWMGKWSQVVRKTGMQQQDIGIIGATKQVTKSRKWATEL